MFEISRKGNPSNTNEAVSTWQYALSSAPGEWPPRFYPWTDPLILLPQGWQDIIPTWIGRIAIDTWPDDGWTAPWKTPKTDQNVDWYVRAVPFDDALNVQVGAGNQKKVTLDGTTPKAKIMTAQRAGESASNANGFMLYPDDTEVKLSAKIVANADYDLSENVTQGVDGINFEYTLQKPVTAENTSSPIEWIPIPASQYSVAQRVPTADGQWQVTWYMNFSQIVNETKDQYIELRARAKDKVGNEDNDDPIHTIMILNNTTGPQAYIRFVDGSNVLDPHLAVTKRTYWPDDEGRDLDPGAVDVEIDAHKVAVATLEYRGPYTTSWSALQWMPVGTKQVTGSSLTMEWIVATLAEGRYQLRVTGFDGDGNMAAEPDVVVVIVDHTEPDVTLVNMWVDVDTTDPTKGFESKELIYPASGDSVYRYMNANGDYYDVKVTVKADATDPVDQVEAESVVLQYFHKASASWKTVPVVEGDTDGIFKYSKATDLWTATFIGKKSYPDAAGLNVLGMLFAQGELNEGKVTFRALVTDYAGNQNSVEIDKDAIFTVIADAYGPNILAVYSGGRAYEGGRTTQVACSGDAVDLWVKVKDGGAGVASVKFYIPASPAAPTASSAVLPVPASSRDYIGAGELASPISGEDFSSVGGEELWHLLWKTPLDQNGNNFPYNVHVIVTDKAGNTTDTQYDETLQAKLIVEKDCKIPDAPQIVFAVTHAGAITSLTDPAQILDDTNACNYGIRKLLPIGADTNLDSSRADKYEVFDLYNKWPASRTLYIHDDQYDTSLEIWVRTPDLEYGLNDIGTVDTRQYENHNSGTALPANTTNTGPSYLKVAKGALKRDPGLVKVYVEAGYDPNQDGDYSDVVWKPLDANTAAANRDPRTAITTADPFDAMPLSEVVQVKLYGSDAKVKGFAYYWVMGDTIGNNVVWNTEATVVTTVVADKGKVLDPIWGKDGIHFIRARAVDASGNVGEYGYQKILVHNQDDIKPAGTFITHINSELIADAAALEWKWHEVVVETRRNTVGFWSFGDGMIGNTYNKFFCDINNIVVEIFDADCGVWTNVTQYLKSTTHVDYNTWKAYIDSTLVADGNPQIRAYAVDNGGRFTVPVSNVYVPYPVGDSNVYLQRNYPNTEDVDSDLAVANRKNVRIDNPHAKVVEPGVQATVERGDVLTIRAMEVANGPDEARNGHDVGQVVFLARRKAAPNGGTDGPWIVLDALDTDLDGEFGDDPVEPSDTNQPYMVHWRIPDWLLIDDPKTEQTLEETAEYYIVAVAGDANTGPLDKHAPDPRSDRVDNDGDWTLDYDREPEGVPGHGEPSYAYEAYVLIDEEDMVEGGVYFEVVVGEEESIFYEAVGDVTPEMNLDEADEFGAQIHWDNPWHIVKCTSQYQLVTVQDTKPPRTRVLQVGQYFVPSETKIKVGKTVTVFAGDTEVDWVAPGTFVSLEGSGAPGDGLNPYAPGVTVTSLMWPAHNAAWSMGMLYPLPYDPDVKPEKYLVNEWRPNNRVTLRYAGPFAADAKAPAFPDSGETWRDKGWETAEADAIHLDSAGNPGLPKWSVTNWVTGGVLSDGKYFITVTATDDVGHTTGELYPGADRVTPDVVDIWVQNEGPKVTLSAAQLDPDGELNDTLVNNGEMERGRPLVLYLDPDAAMPVADLDKVTFMYKAAHDYDYTVVVNNSGATFTQPYSVLLDPRFAWSGVTDEPGNLVLGAEYWFKAVAEDNIGNKKDSNVIKLVVVDREATASIAMIQRLDGYNSDEQYLWPRMILDEIPRLTGRVYLTGFTDADVVGVTFMYKLRGASWDDAVEIEAILNNDWSTDGRDNDGDWVGPEYYDGEVVNWHDDLSHDGIDGYYCDANGNWYPEPNVDEEDEGWAWDTVDWLFDGIDNDKDGEIDEAGECGYHYRGQQNWSVLWDTTVVKAGVYELAVVANTGENKSDVSDSLVVIIDHNAYDIFDLITEWQPTDDDWVGGWSRRPVQAENPILDPDDKLTCRELGEVDVFIAFEGGLPSDLDMGIPTGVIRDNDGINNNKYDDVICDEGCKEQTDEFDENLMEEGTALNPAVSFQWKESSYPDIGDENVNDKPNMDQSHWYWKPIDSPVVYDAATGRFTAVWHTVADLVLNGYYDIRVRIVDEAGNVAYKVIAQRVVVDNTGPDSMITNIDGDTSLTYIQMATDKEGNDIPIETGTLATDTEIANNAKVVVKATVRDSLTAVAYVQFQVRMSTLQSGVPLAGNRDELNLLRLDLTEWTDLGLASETPEDPQHPNSYALHWNTTGLLEGDYLLRLKSTDVVGNKSLSNVVKVTVVDTTPPIATIVGYYPEQYQFLHALWPQKWSLSPQKYYNYMLDNIYAATIGQSDIQEVQIQYRREGVGNWVTIGVPTLIPFGNLDTPADKLEDISEIWYKQLYPDAVRIDKAILEAFDWTGLWGTTWKAKLAELEEGAMYELRAVAKDWSGNVAPELAPILKFRYENGVVNYEPDPSGMEISFTADIGGTGLGDSLIRGDYKDSPSVVVSVDVESGEKPTVLVLVEVDSPEGLVYGGEIIDVWREEGAPNRFNGVLDGEGLTIMIGNRWERLPNYLELIRLGGKITVFASTPSGMTSTVLTMDDLKVYPVTAELGTNGTVKSKDGALSVMVPRAALYEEDQNGKTVFVERAGLMITPSIKPNTPKDQKLTIEPVGQAYAIEFFNYLPKYLGFRPGFEPLVTIDYSNMDIPPSDEALGFVSVRYWDPQLGRLPDGTPVDPRLVEGRWANDNIINLRVDPDNNTLTFNLKGFADWWYNVVTGDSEDGSVECVQGLRPNVIFSIVLEKTVGRVGEVVFWDRQGNEAYVYPSEEVSYLTGLAGGEVGFRISDPSGIDENSIRVYIDGELYSVGIAGRTNGFASSVYPVAAPEDINRAYVFEVPGDLPFTEGFHTLRIEAWDKSDDIYEENWLVIEKTVEFYIDRTTPMVVTHAAQKDGVRWFSTPQGAVAAVTIVDEGVGLSAAQLQKSIFVDVFEHLNKNNTPMRTQDQGEIVNFQRKVLITTSRPILEYADDYTPDGIDNETWIGIYSGASEVRHQAWRASYTIHSGEVNDGDTYEVVFYASKNAPRLEDDWYNENAIYLYEDLTTVYLMAWNGEGTVNAYADANDGGWTFVGVRAQDYWESDILDMWTIDPFTNYYRGTFLVDILGNNGAVFVEDAGRRAEDLAADSGTDSSHHGSYVQPDVFFVRNLVADTRPPLVDLKVPTGVRADDLAATVSVSVIDDASGIQKVSLIINGKVVGEKTGPSSSASLDYTFGKGEAASANEIKVVATDMAGNEVVQRAAFGVQETDNPVISGMAPEGNGIKDATPTIAASYSDASGIDLGSVTLTLNGAVITGATVGQSMVSYTPVEPLETGVTYTVKLAVKDKAGAASEKIWTFALETEAPSITDTRPAGVDETGTPVISAKFSDAGTGIDKSSAKLLLDSVAVGAEVTNSTVTYKPSNVLKKGKHSATFSVADVAGNVAELTWEFSIETTAPSITDVKPSGVIYSDTPILSASFSDSGTGINLSSVVLSLDGESVKAEVTESTVSYGVKEPLKTGISYTIGVTVADKAGNVATTSRTFTLETAVPVITAEDPKDKSTVNSVDVAISANYSDGSGVGVDQATALMKVDGVAVGGTPSASGISYLATGLTKGNHTVYVEVADQFGNVGYKTWSFIVEQTPPTIAKIEPSGNVNTATPVVSAAYSDAGTGIDVSSVVISLNGQVLPATVTASEASFEVLTPLKLGVTYKVAVQVADKAGNIASGNSTFSLETTPPKVSSTKPTGTVGEAVAASGIVISAELSDTGSGVDADSVVVWVDGGVVNAEATVESIQYIAKGLGYGEHTVRLLVSDMLGNSTDEVWKFSVADSTPPTVMVLSPKQDSVVGERPLIKISYADEGSGVDLASISVKVDDKPVMASAMAPAGAKVVAAGEASYEVKLGYGAHTLTVELQDVAGNKGTAEVKFIVEGDALKLVKPHNYPNPFGTESSSTKIVFGLSQSARVTVRIYDFTATLVATVVDDELVGADENVEISWNGMTDSGDGDQLANGVYFCNILAKTGSETKSEIVKIALVRE